MFDLPFARFVYGFPSRGHDTSNAFSTLYVGGKTEIPAEAGDMPAVIDLYVFRSARATYATRTIDGAPIAEVDKLISRTLPPALTFHKTLRKLKLNYFSFEDFPDFRKSKLTELCGLCFHCSNSNRTLQGHEFTGSIPFHKLPQNLTLLCVNSTNGTNYSRNLSENSFSRYNPASVPTKIETLHVIVVSSCSNL